MGRHDDFQIGDLYPERREHIYSQWIPSRLSKVWCISTATVYTRHAEEARRDAPFQLRLTCIRPFAMIRGFATSRICIVVCSMPSKDQHRSNHPFLITRRLSLQPLDAAYAARKQEEWLYRRSDIQCIHRLFLRWNVKSERLLDFSSTSVLISEMSRFNATNSRSPLPIPDRPTTIDGERHLRLCTRPLLSTTDRRLAVRASRSCVVEVRSRLEDISKALCMDVARSLVDDR
jgi:hypothetical protein